MVAKIPDNGLNITDLAAADDFSLSSDSAVINFGADGEIKLTHVADTGLALKHTATADDKPIVLTLQTGEIDMAANDVIGKIAFQAPDEGTGTDAILVSAAIQARAEGNHSSSSNATSLDFMTGASEAAAKKWSITSGGSFLNAGTNTIDMNAGELILDADADTSLTADTDDQIDVKIAGADDFQFTANDFTALSGSVISTDTINETTGGSGVTVDSLVIKDQKITNWVGASAQVIQGSVSGGNTNIASATYTDTGATVTITPQYATSKILVFARGCYTIGRAHDSVYGGIQLVRNVGGGGFSSLVAGMADTTGPYEISFEEAGTGENKNGIGAYYNYVFLDDPDTTSACIYKLQARVYSTADSQTINFGNSGGGGGAQTQQMIAMEILHGS